MKTRLSSIFRFVAIVCIGLIFNWGGVNSLYAQNPEELPFCNPDACSEHPTSCRTFYDVYANLAGTPYIDIAPCYTNLSGFECQFTGEYETLDWLLPHCAATNCRETYLSLMSFPFGVNIPRTLSAETNASCTNCKRVFTIKEQFKHILTDDNSYSHNTLVSRIFTSSALSNGFNYEEIGEVGSISGRNLLPHSVIKHNIYNLCGDIRADSIAVVVDNTRGRARYYPFKNCNWFSSSGSCSTTDTEHDIAILPYVVLNESFSEPENFNYLNYFPADGVDIPLCESINYFSLDASTEPQYDFCQYLHPLPYSMVGFHLRSNQFANFPLGYRYSDGEVLPTIESGIRHTYIVDKNYDITQINPHERIFYNPSEVYIEADNLIFPSGYSFVTARGTPPTLDDIDNTPCSAKNTLDLRYMPVITDQPNTTYTKTDETTVTVKPSVYILEPGSKLTIEPCVHLYDMTIVVKPGARLVYYPNQLYGNFDPETDIITDGSVSSGAIIEKEYEGLCHDCRCEQNFGIANGINIDTEVEWENEFLTVLGQIVVKPGGKLSIIDSELQFFDSQITGVPTGITVAPGGKLYLRNTKLTALNCHNMWDGIKIQGNDDLPQYPETNQGTLYIVGGVIEKARVAQSAGGEASVEGGGIIKAMNATFRNNDIAIMAGVYQPNSASIFRNCIFEQTTPIKHTHSPDPGTYGQTPSAFAQAVLVDSRGIKFVNCTFQNKRLVNKQSFDEQKGLGILAYLSDFYAGPDYWSVSTPPPPNPLSASSAIKGFYKGIDTYGALGWGSRATIWHTRFENNLYGYVGNGSNLDQITESEFYSDFDESENYFIFFHNATNYTVAGNVFEYANPISTPGFDGYGVHCRQTGSNNGGSVFYNIFKSLYQGVIVEGDNPSLEVKCNVFDSFLPNGTDDYRFPWVLKAFSSTAPLNIGNQGISCDPGETAGNLFNDMGTERIHIFATDKPQNDFTYFANGTPAETVPNIDGVTYIIGGVTYYTAANITNENCFNVEDDPDTCPHLPELGGFPGGTGVGNGSPSDYAGHISTNSASNTARVNRAARATQHYLQNDSTRQEAMAFLTEFDDPQAWRMLLGAYLQQADTAQIRLYRELLEAESDTDPYLIDYYKLLAIAIADGRNLHQLQNAEIETLENIARSASPAAVYAESLLAMPTLSTYIRQTVPIQTSEKRQIYASVSPSVSWLYPNPATSTISVINTQPWQSLILYNLHGQIVAKYDQPDQSNFILPETIPNGLYIAYFLLVEGGVQTSKILISK